MEKEITIYDLAKILALSPATVSRALNDHPAINVKTKMLIAEKAAELGYRSNTFASHLRTRKTNTLGVIVPRLNSNFMSTVLAGMEEVANNFGYNLLISQSLESEAKERANAKTMFNSRVDGLLVSVAYDTDSFDHFSAFIDRNIPVLFFDRVLAHPQCGNVVIDNEQAGYDAARHLLDEGCRKLIHVTGDLRRNVYADRLAGFQRAMKKADIRTDDTMILTTDLSQDAGRSVAEKIHQMDQKPGGLFIANDLCAVTCMQALQERGYSIPTDIAVVGFNNDPVSQVITPQLTTVFYPGYQMGKTAMMAVVGQLNGTKPLDFMEPIILRSELMIRRSSKRSESS
ncbi:LacI family transcriptional regulator [Dyadobacter sp. CY261]|uniref:LacI family DNA-binding transcriptional regulator n=1 Tax=Dyadobacter sp. CY261 TaxID=2907203 RepID=UPI001F467C50|nr:LacI family DNA-binding transcriptional regulator [Dyadobacter sp. CY261]MCF0072094.1 LacI family transcriptional regulator [Dyadobacter sp. CY261]